MGAPRKTVRRKLTELILGTSFLLLAVTLTGLAAYEVHSYRQATARSLSTIAEIIAENSAAVLIFDDEKLAQEILGGLRVEPEIAAAALFNQDGLLYATYPRHLASSAFPPAPAHTGISLGLRDLTLWQPVMHGDKRVGTLYFNGDLRGTYQRLGVFALVLVVIGAAASVIAFALSHFLQRRISQPLADLARSARTITSEKDYSIRALKTSDDEFGDLTDALNSMLDQIQASNLALREQEERFRTLADNMVQLAWMADEKGEFLWYNKRWHDYTGLDFAASKISGWDHVHPDHRSRIATRLKACFETGAEWEDTFPLRGRDGHDRWFLSHAIPIRDHRGKVLRWFGTNTDVTELREIQQDLRRARDEAVAASGAKDEFLARLSHELRTPLSPVLLLVSEQSQNQQLPAELRGDFETIKNNVELEARLIDDLLDLTAIVRGKLVLHKHPVPLNDVVRDALAKIAADAHQRRVTVKLQLDPANPVVVCDAVRVQQAFWNVLRNAVKFSHEGGAISVSTRFTTASRIAIVTVADEGVGMSPEELSRIFDAFAQGDHAGGGGSHRFGGLGLGLAIARRVIELHSGRIVATSPGRDKGSTFRFELPLEEIVPTAEPAAPRDSAHHHVSPLPRRELRVLLVEDHTPTRVTLDRLLSRRNLKVTCAGSAAEARAAFPLQPFDLLISDIGLPDGSGYELMKEFAAQTNIPGIALTGYGMDGDVKRAMEAGFRIHLTKPIKVESLDLALNSAMGASGTPETTPAR